MLATLVDTGALLKTVAAAFVAGVGVTLIFSLAILGAARFAELSRDERPRRRGVVWGARDRGPCRRRGRGDDRDNRHDQEVSARSQRMRNVRNIAIIALIAVPVAFLPGGGQAAQP